MICWPSGYFSASCAFYCQPYLHMFILKYKSLWRHLSFTQRGTMCLRNFLNAGFQHHGVYYGTKHNPGYSWAAPWVGTPL